MTPQEALNIVDQAIAQVVANRETHATLESALKVLRETIEPQN